MASISTRMITKSAAVAGALGLAVALGAPAANADEGDLDFGSLFGILDLGVVEGSVTESLGGGGPDTGSAGSLGAFLNGGSLEEGVETAQGSNSGSAGSLGEVAGTLNPAGFGQVVGGSIETMSAEEEGATGSLGEISSDSIENLFETIKEIGNAGGDTTGG